MNKTDLKEAAGISFNVMARMGKNETISFDSIEKICMVLDCNIGDIIEIVKPKKEVKKPGLFPLEISGFSCNFILDINHISWVGRVNRDNEKTAGFFCLRI